MARNTRKNIQLKHLVNRDLLRTVLIGVRVTYDEDDWVTRQAMKLGISRPDVCREALLVYMESVKRKEVRAETTIDAIDELGSEGAAKEIITGEVTSNESTRNGD